MHTCIVGTMEVVAILKCSLNYRNSSVKQISTKLFVLFLCIYLASAENIFRNEEKYKLLDAWKPPSVLSKNFTYYMSGYDYFDRPVWVIELGKWNFVNLLERGSLDTINKFEKYTEQIFFRIHNSPYKLPNLRILPGEQDENQLGQNKTQEYDRENENLGEGWVLIADMDGFDLEQLTSAKAIQMALQLAHKLEIAAQNMEYGIIINANYVADRFINLLRPVLGNTLSKLDTYGTRREIWKPQLLKKISRDQIPEFYGGDKIFKPIAVFG